jgi:DnaJ-class molecular chaperone
MQKLEPKTKPLPCNHCEGQGYTVIRDCVGEIQYESTCPMCGGTGTEATTAPPSDIDLEL